jgi:hypothetical protein
MVASLTRGTSVHHSEARPKPNLFNTGRNYGPMILSTFGIHRMIRGGTKQYGTTADRGMILGNESINACSSGRQWNCRPRRPQRINMYCPVERQTSQRCRHTSREVRKLKSKRIVPPETFGVIGLTLQDISAILINLELLLWQYPLMLSRYRQNNESVVVWSNFFRERGIVNSNANSSK